MARRKQKQLLSEGEMRRFMKLAKISPINEMEHPGMRDDGEEDEPGMRDYMQESEHDDEMEVSADEMEMDDVGMPDDMDAEPEMEMDMEPEMDMDMGAPTVDGTVNIEDFMSALERALEDITGEEVSTEMDLDDEEAPLEGGDELDMEMPPEPAMDMDMGDDEEEMDMDNSMNEGQKNINKRADELTEKIFRRLIKESR